MKICDKCGAYNSDDRMFCVDCDEKLDDSTIKANENLNQEVSSKIDKLYNSKDPLCVSCIDKIFGGVSLTGIIATIIVFFLNTATQTSCDGLGWALIAFAVSIFEAFCPGINWELEKLRLSFRINGASDAEPSDFYFIRRKLAIILSLLLGTIMLVINMVQ